MLEYLAPFTGGVHAGTPGFPGDTTADLVFGQFDSFVHDPCTLAGPAHPDGGGPPSADNLCGPVAEAVDPQGNVYISDFNNSRVLKYLNPGRIRDPNCNRNRDCHCDRNRDGDEYRNADCDRHRDRDSDRNADRHPDAGRRRIGQQEVAETERAADGDGVREHHYQQYRNGSAESQRHRAQA